MSDLTNYLTDYLKQKIEQIQQQKQAQQQAQAQAQQQALTQQNILQIQYELFLLLSKISTPSHLNPLHFVSDLAPRGFSEDKYYYAWSKLQLEPIADVILQKLKNNLNNHIIICKKRLYNDSLCYPNIYSQYPILLEKGICIYSIFDNSDEILLAISIPT